MAREEASERRTIRDKKYARRYFASITPFIAIAAIAFYFLWTQFEARDVYFAMALVVFAVDCVLGLVVQFSIMSKYYCQECGRTINRADGPRGVGSKVIFHCPHCNIDWDTGMRIGDGG